MRRLSILLSACGMISAALLWCWLARLLPVDPQASSTSVRLALAAAALLPACAVLSAMIAAQIAVRFATGALDPTLGRDGRFLLLNQRAISNTLEQLAVFVPALLALSAGRDAALMPKVVAAGITFGVARLVFWIGYLAAPILRAPGMAASGMLGLCTLAVAIWVWL